MKKELQNEKKIEKVKLFKEIKSNKTLKSIKGGHTFGEAYSHIASRAHAC